MSKQKAKIASKNNPNARGVAKVHKYQGRDVEPVLVVSDDGKVFCAQYKDNEELVCDNAGQTLPWSSVVSAGEGL
ncbi:hypothetical protein Sarmat_00845 [Rickettsiales endosymbiont of Paramecium tredecaurelia]|uniref:hypothetical protein n=1 Tax=Candidatus Sarmatiella mevalonica TaxID=2770581 RepID=UPI001923F942|nr:hypothetical protein [Candidatus Sarmatiella mevalonica]MBL3284983.1 hypothetical protein [Candidatus Sarmatiella mevalonica]